MDSKDKKTRNIIILVSCILVLTIVMVVISIFSKNQDLETIVQDVTIGTSETTISTTAMTTIVTTTETTTEITTTPEVTTEVTTMAETTEPKLDYTPAIKKDTVLNANSTNPDCKGWIYIKNSAIDYPVMQSEDNEFYVYHSWTGAESGSGSIMLDYECTIGRTNNTILYGHNMGNGSMFHQIKSYKDSSWWLNHQYVELANLENIYVYQIFSVDVLNGLSDASFTYWIEPNKSLPTEEDYNYFIDNVLANRYTSVGISKPNYPTGLLTLQTCNSGANDGMRCVAFGKLVGIFELE